MTFRTLDQLDARGKRVLLRVDLNVPMKDGKVSDRTRLDRLCPTVRELSDKGARLVLCSHFGRAVVAATRAGELTSVAGGGDTVAMLHAAGVAEGFTYVSTAGGAFLEWLEGRTLPGVAALGG